MLEKCKEPDAQCQFEISDGIELLVTGNAGALARIEREARTHFFGSILGQVLRAGAPAFPVTSGLLRLKLTFKRQTKKGLLKL